MEKILLADNLHQVTIIAIMILYNNAKVCRPDNDTEFFVILLQGNSLTPNMFIICLVYLLRMSERMKENDLTMRKVRNRQYPA